MKKKIDQMKTKSERNQFGEDQKIFGEFTDILDEYDKDELSAKKEAGEDLTNKKRKTEHKKLEQISESDSDLEADSVNQFVPPPKKVKKKKKTVAAAPPTSAKFVSQNNSCPADLVLSVGDRILTRIPFPWED